MLLRDKENAQERGAKLLIMLLNNIFEKCVLGLGLISSTQSPVSHFF